MKRQADLWIDHSETFIVFIEDDGEETRRIESGMEKHVRFSGGSRSEEGSADDLSGFFDSLRPRTFWPMASLECSVMPRSDRICDRGAADFGEGS